MWRGSSTPGGMRTHLTRPEPGDEESIVPEDIENLQDASGVAKHGDAGVRDGQVQSEEVCGQEGRPLSIQHKDHHAVPQPGQPAWTGTHSLRFTLPHRKTLGSDIHDKKVSAIWQLVSVGITITTPTGDFLLNLCDHKHKKRYKKIHFYLIRCPAPTQNQQVDSDHRLSLFRKWRIYVHETEVVIPPWNLWWAFQNDLHVWSVAAAAWILVVTCERLLSDRELPIETKGNPPRFLLNPA